jgi:hypothetical protein
MGLAQAEAIAVLQAEADALDDEARLHKRLEGTHRRSAREARQRLAALREAAEALGIQLRIVHGHSPKEDIDR